MPTRDGLFRRISCEWGDNLMRLMTVPDVELQPEGGRVGRRRVCFVATVEMPVESFLLDHMRALSGSYDISVAVSTKNPRFLERSGVPVSILPVRIERKPSPLRD